MQILAEIHFASQKEIQWLNKKYRGIDKSTDVLSFPLDFDQGADGVLRLGDIVICKSKAKEKNHQIEFLIKHGMLKLLGNHHK